MTFRFQPLIFPGCSYFSKFVFLMIPTFTEATSSSDCDESMVAPTRFRLKAVALAVVAGTCWGFGPLGKKATRPKLLKPEG